MLTGSAGSTGVEELLFLASATRLVRVDADAFVDWVCRMPRTGVFVIVAGARGRFQSIALIGRELFCRLSDFNVEVGN